MQEETKEAEGDKGGDEKEEQTEEEGDDEEEEELSLIHISEPTRRRGRRRGMYYISMSSLTLQEIEDVRCNLYLR